MLVKLHALCPNNWTLLTLRGVYTAAVNAEALQKWLWQCVAAGWDPTGGVDSHWSHDDNKAANRGVVLGE